MALAQAIDKAPIETPARRRGWRPGIGVMASPLVVALVLTTLYPLVALIALSFSRSTLGRPLRDWAGIANFERILGDPVFLASLWRSAAFAVPMAAIELVLGLALALLFHRLVRAGRLFTSLALLPLMTPPVMVGVAWKLIFAADGGLLNGWLRAAGLIDAPMTFLGSSSWAAIAILAADAWQWTPFVALFCFAAIRGLPEEVMEAARLDGATIWQRFLHIALPLLVPTLAAVFLLRLVMAFKLFDIVYVLTFGGPGFDTTTSGFQIWRLAFEQFDIGRASAATLVFVGFVSLVIWPASRTARRLETRFS